MVKRALLPLLFALVLGQATTEDLGGIVTSNVDVSVATNKPPPPEATGSITEAERIRRENLHQQFGDGKLNVQIDSIFPKAGPTGGETRVLIRGGPFQDMNLLYPQPKCKFGGRDMIVGATYVTCTQKPLEVYEYEGGHQNRDSYCIQCDSSPPSKEAGMVSLMVSLTGDFSDSNDSEPYLYYLAPKITAIYPRYGSKDGDTEVQVWGENFLNFAQHTRCGFGSKTTVAHFISSTYMICKSATSEVVGKAIPFTVSLNQQQNTKENINFWYYNRPSVSLLIPNYGPDQGGNTITLKGANFQPFDWQRDIDNRNDTFCWFEQENVYMPLTAISPTKATCEVPPDLLHIGSTFVEVTLNNNRYPVSQPTGDKTDDNVPYFYFKPSRITNIEPKEGPTSGGTIVMVYGADFMAGKKIICNFDGIQTRGFYVGLGQIKCKTPPHSAGPINLSIAYDGEDSKFASEQATFLYYETPVVTSIDPACGPVTGYTQIRIKGKNFVEMGFGKVHCLFNGTSMNATVLDQQTLVCDSPRLSDDQARLDHPYLFANVQVTLNGRDTSAELIKFNYYPELNIQQVDRNVGPVSGKTTTILSGLNFIHPHVCNPAVRYGALTVKPQIQNDQFIISSPQVSVPGAVTLFASGNGQNYPTDYTLHYRNIENTFTYIQDVFVQDLTPSTGPSTGGTKIIIRGYGFMPLKHNNGTINEVKPLVRFVDASGNQIGKASEVIDTSNTQFTWFSPPGPVGTKVSMQISYNNEYFQNLYPSGQQYSFTYYNAPIVNSIVPKYGPVKFSQNATINGNGFQCPESTCANLLIRFGSEKQGTIVQGQLLSSSQIQVVIPAYTKPDVLPIEISFNGIDFTHSNLTYGYFDPFVIKTTPVLVSSSHQTTLQIKGFGFINPEDSNDIKVKFTSPKGDLTCVGVSPCIVQGTFIDKETITAQSFLMSQVYYADGTPVKIADPLYTEVTLLNSIFTDNRVPIYYYSELIHKSASDAAVTTNIEQPILVETDFNWDLNHLDLFEKYGNFTCVYQVGDERVEVPGRLETMPFGAQYDSSVALPTHVACSTPHLHNSGQGTLSITPNGQTLSAVNVNHINLDYQPTLELVRILPQCGPIDGQTRVKLMGLSFNNPKDTVYNKFGVHSVSQLQRASVQTMAWSQQEWLDPQLLTNGDLSSFKHIDYALKQGDNIQSIYVTAPRSPSSMLGGAVYVDVGQHIQLSQITSDGSNKTAVIESYANSMVEYYYYKSPQVVKVEPNAGLAIGGTPIEISGAWFDLKLEYGLVPHCKIGDKIVRATLSSTVRIVCHSPPNQNLDQPMPVKVSLNGVDWVDTKFTFSYYIQPTIYDVYPKYGQMNGGTEVFIQGENFSNITDPEVTKCRWTLIDNANGIKRDRIIQFTPAYYLNSSQMMCITPSSFIGGDRALIQITFNSKDYSQEDHLIFQFYSILGSFPKSGPSNGRNEVILVKGAGFKPTSTIYCFLNKTEKMPAIEVTENLIKCPMIWPSKDLTSTGAVRFGISMEGSWTDFGDFFYYTQIELDDVYPRYGPAEGHGIIYLTGTKFRDDYHNSELGCKIGDNIGKGEIMNQTCIRCVVEQMDLVNEGETLPVMVALNSYSWVGEKSNSRLLSSETKGFIPYGVQKIFPESGVLEGFTDIFVTGKGFTPEIAAQAKCRFGVDSNYHIVDAEVIDYTKLVCRSPTADFNNFESSQQISVPFSISFGEQENKPWTQDLHRFRFYKQPILAYAVPDEINIRKKTEIYVFADDSSKFYQPVPSLAGLQDHHGTSGVSCSFGEFGTSMGMYVNQTTMLCLTPHISGSTDDYSSTTVTVGIAMNGQDFLEDTSQAQVTFVGTGSSHLFLNFIISALLIALLCLAVFTFIMALLNWMNPPQEMKSNVILLRGLEGSQSQLRNYNNSMRARTPNNASLF